jgi:hypothetical protein
LDEVWPAEQLAAAGTVLVDLEITRVGRNEADAVMEARADLVIRADQVVVVIENKLDAGEQPGQCERLYWAFVEESVDTRWIFLSPTGHRPATPVSPRARSAWRVADYDLVRRALRRALAEAKEATPTMGRSTGLQYLATLDTFSRGFND